MAPALPATSPLPPLPFMPAQSPRVPPPTASSIPPQLKKSSESAPKGCGGQFSAAEFILPKLRLEIRDLGHGGAQTFLSSVLANEALVTSVKSVLKLLYKTADCPTTTVPSTRSVTLVLRPMGGVAYTTGCDLDSDHKEIHFSLDYICGVAPGRRTEEIMGVLTHEMVHCYQYTAFRTCPGGLIEGVADWVRLNANLSPPHWKKEATGKWDAGYQHTGYFLEYLEKRYGLGLVRKLNEKLRIARYDEKRFWTELCGRPVEQLWGDYQQVVEKENKKVDDSGAGSRKTEVNGTQQSVDSQTKGSKNLPTPTATDKN